MAGQVMGAGIAARLAQDQVIAGPVVLLALECPPALGWPRRPLSRPPSDLL
jgi:hypothetical protein